MSYYLYLCSSEPFDFHGYCSVCHRQTKKTVAVDVSHSNVPLQLAELAVPALALANLKSVPIAFCPRCRGSLSVLRHSCTGIALVFVWLIVRTMSRIDSHETTDADIAMYTLGAGIVGLILLPIVYTRIKGRCLGVAVSCKDGIYYYAFRNRSSLEFLESQGLCTQASSGGNIWLAIKPKQELIALEE